ncbi:MAG: hypothetical protein SGJ15_15250 [Bacteroidota bacterium]|nr:hypothetical protein [Bacteroidota bacterium]
MKKILLLTIFSAIGLNLIAQGGIEGANKKISKLKKSKVDTIVSVYRYSSGMTMETKKGKDCFLTASQMLFWVKDGECFKQAFDNCKDYDEKKIDSTLYIASIRDSIKVIKDAEIKPVKCVFRDMDGVAHYKKNNAPIHSKFTDITFYIGAATLTKKIDHYHINTENCDEEHINDNFETNMGSILKRFFDEADREFRDK